MAAFGNAGMDVSDDDSDGSHSHRDAELFAGCLDEDGDAAGTATTTSVRTSMSTATDPAQAAGGSVHAKAKGLYVSEAPSRPLFVGLEHA
eukprot:m.144609 g.144609  ORF g.144609 m.144609 type:complete len:90 (-) comp17199_c0_seq1:230-499(-)